jgi:hypothetical protein
LNFYTLLGVNILQFDLLGTVGTAVGSLYGVGIGQDFWISDEWSFSFNAQISGGELGNNDTHITRSHNVWLPTLTVGATFH